tara:strand:- start:67 stop:312 length:246 start_codon:yes stop_codon:yes gene_type:complete
MITDEKMRSLGFKKIRTHKIKQTSVSCFCWEKYGFILTIEKDLGSNFNDSVFMPTLRVGFAVWFFKEIKDIKILLEALSIN